MNHVLSLKQQERKLQEILLKRNVDKALRYLEGSLDGEEKAEEQKSRSFDN